MAIAGCLIVLVQWANARPLWLDEEMIAINIRDRSFAGLAGRLWLDQSAPFGWLVVQRAMLLAFGPSELVLRAVPAAFGVAMILAALYVGRRWLTPIGSTALVLLCSLGQWVSFYAVELKSYSADMFFGLWLPALAVGAAAAETDDARSRRLTIFAAAAAIGHWFSLGALLVLPVCLIVLAVSFSRHQASLRRFTVGAVIVLASCAAHYLLSIRHTHASESLQQYWQFALPPAGAGVAGAAQWLYGQLEPFALKPGGTGYGGLFWAAAAFGFAAAVPRLLGVTAGLVAASGLMLAAFGVMPLYERLSLWFVPALYLGIALAADRGVWFVRQHPLDRRWMNAAAAAGVAVMVVPLCADIADRGVRDLRIGRPATSNRSTDDRSAVSWLARERRAGDVLVTTAHAVPAVWWYAGVPLSHAEGRKFPDGGRILVAEHHQSERACRGRTPEVALRKGERIQVYLGFVDVPDGFDDLLLRQLSHVAPVTTIRHFEGASRAAVVDPAWSAPASLTWEDADTATERELEGCIALRPGRLW